MKITRLVVAWLAVLGGLLFGFPTAVSAQQRVVPFDARAVSNSPPIPLIGTGIRFHRLYWYSDPAGGTISSCSFNLGGGIDGTTYGTTVISAQNCAATGSVAVSANLPINYVLMRLTAFTASAGATVRLVYMGWIINPDLSSGPTVAIDQTTPGFTNMVSTIFGQNGIAGGTGVDSAMVPRMSLATNVPLPVGTNSIGQVTTNAGTNTSTAGLATAANQTNASQKSQLVDGSGNVAAMTANALNVAIVSGGGSGGTSSTFGAGIPGVGTAVGLSDGTNMQAPRVFDLDTGGGSQYVQGMGIRLSSSGGSVEGGTGTNPLRIDPTGSTIQPVSGTITANAGTNLNTSALAVETGGNLATLAGTVSANRLATNLIAGQIGVAGGTGVDGATVQRVSLATNVALPTGANSIGQVTANAGTNLNTSALATSANQTNASQKTQLVDGSGNVIAASSNALNVNVVSGGGTGGTSSTFGAAIPGTGTAVGYSDGTNMRPPRVYDTDSAGGTEYTAGVILRLSGSGGSVEGGTGANPLRVDPTGTTVQPVSVPVITYAVQPTLTLGQTQVDYPITARGALIVNQGVEPFSVRTLGTNGETITPVTDPCTGLAKLKIPIDISTATTTVIQAASASNKLYICSIFLYADANEAIRFVEDATAACASPDAPIIGGMATGHGVNLIANQGFAPGSGAGTIAGTASTNVNTCIVTTNTAQLSGVITGVLAP